MVPPITSATTPSRSRYLLFYLQERGLLREYFRAFVANVAQDPSGLGTLTSVFHEPDVHAFRLQWEAFVLGLTFVPRR